jgi:hypothetical protein
MEYHINKQFEVARKIFELGLRKFSDQIDFILQYIDFMMHTNDDNSSFSHFSHSLSFSLIYNISIDSFYLIRFRITLNIVDIDTI